MLQSDSGFIKKSLCELVHIPLYLAQPKRFYVVFVLTCPNLGLTFLGRLGRLQPVLDGRLRCFGLTGPAFFHAHMPAARKLCCNF